MSAKAKVVEIEISQTPRSLTSATRTLRIAGRRESANSGEASIMSFLTEIVVILVRGWNGNTWLSSHRTTLERWDKLIGDGEEEHGVGVEEGAYERGVGHVVKAE